MTTPGGLNVGGVYYDVELNTAGLIRDSRKAETALSGVEFRMGALAVAVKALVAALALLKMAQVADDMRLLQARVEVAAGSVERGADAFSQLARISARTATEIAANVQVFTRLNGSIMQMGGTQQDTLRITELLAKAIKVSGATSAEAASAMTQFGQALGSGKLAGDELRSLLENAPFLMRQLADGIGVPVGALKKLGEEGKLTADVVVAALSKAAGQIEADFKKLPVTFEAAMGALVDQLRLASKAADDLTGTSAALTGIAQGAAEAVGMLADQLKAANGEATGLSRNDSVSRWSRSTAEVLSYVADAADFVGRYFKVAGIAIGGTAAAMKSFASGLSGARQVGDIVAQMRADIGAISGESYVGQRIRQRAAALADGTDGSDPLDRLARTGKPSRLRAPPPDPGKSKKDKAAADDILEQIKQRTEAEAKLEQLEGDRIRAADERAEKEAQARERARQDQQKSQNMAFDALAAGNPVAQLGLELERKSQLLREAAERDQANEDLYAQARVQLANDTAARILQIQQDEVAQRQALQSQTLQGFGNLFGSLADLSKQFAGEQSGIYKAMFVASKAFAIADSIIKIQQGIANAASLPFPANLSAIGSVVAATGSVLSTIKGTSYGGGRQFGGPVSAGSLYRVNETGAPEMFVGSGGRQFMLPTQGGQVVPADQVGAAPAVHVNVHNYSAHPVDVRAASNGRDVDVIVGRVKGELAAEFRENTGPVFSALTSSTNVRPRM